MKTAVVAFGANLGEPRQTYRQCQIELAAHPRIGGVLASRLYRTAAVGGPPGQRDYCNGCLVLDTDLAPLPLLRLLQETEEALGRVRTAFWGPRTIDLDLLLLEQCCLETPELLLPHPRLHYRRFVLAPLCAVRPQAVHPLLGTSAAELLRRLDHWQTLVLAGGPPELAKVARGQPELRGRTVVWRPAASLTRVRMIGPHVVAAEELDPTAAIDPARTWVLLLDEPGGAARAREADSTSPRPLQAGQQSPAAAPDRCEGLLPVVDLRAAGAPECLQQLQLFLAAAGAAVPR